MIDRLALASNATALNASRGSVAGYTRKANTKKIEVSSLNFTPESYERVTRVRQLARKWYFDTRQGGENFTSMRGKLSDIELRQQRRPTSSLVFFDATSGVNCVIVKNDARLRRIIDRHGREQKEEIKVTSRSRSYTHVRLILLNIT